MLSFDMSQLVPAVPQPGESRTYRLLRRRTSLQVMACRDSSIFRESLGDVARSYAQRLF